MLIIFALCFLLPIVSYFPIAIAYENHKQRKEEEYKEEIAREKAAEAEKERKRKAAEREERERRQAQEEAAARAEREQRRQEKEARAAAAHAVKLARAKELAELAERKLAAEKELAELKKSQAETSNAAKAFQPAPQKNVVSVEQKKAACDLPENIANSIDSSAFEGETVTFSGTAPGFKRRDCMKIVQAAGGSAFEDINTRCTLLVICNKPGKSKQETAEKWGLNVITWAEFAERAGIAA